VVSNCLFKSASNMPCMSEGNICKTSWSQLKLKRSIISISCFGEVQNVRHVSAHFSFYITTQMKVTNTKIQHSWRPQCCTDDSVIKHFLQCTHWITCNMHSSIALPTVTILSFIITHLFKKWLQYIRNALVWVHGFVVKYWTSDLPSIYSKTYSSLNVM
jgi:hypothetical protein